MTDRDTITLPREVAYQVPLHELLESVPLDARLVIDYADGRGTAFIPVGRYCHEAATALRTALAAEPTKQEPVAWMESPHGAIRANLDYRFNWPSQLHWQIPLYAAPPDAPTVKESLTHPGYIIGSHWLETAYSRVCAGEAEADVLRDIGLVREEAFLTGVAHLKAENESLRRDAERYNWVLKWLMKNGLLSRERCRIDSPASYGNWWILRKPRSIDGGSFVAYGADLRDTIDAAMEASTAPASAAADASTAPEAKP